jgi:hypothetical protein
MCSKVHARSSRASAIPLDALRAAVSNGALKPRQHCTFSNPRSVTLHSDTSMASVEISQRQVDQFFEDLDRSFWMSPLRCSLIDIEPFRARVEVTVTPGVDVVEDDASQVTAELPSMNRKNMEVARRRRADDQG